MLVQLGIRKKSVAFVLNLLIVMFSIVGAILSITKYEWRAFEFYTENSNYIGLITSGIFCVACLIAMLKKSSIAKWVHILRYIATVCLTLTLIVVLALLIPMMPSMVNELIFNGIGLYYHLICPLLSIVSFVFFERECEFNKKDIYLSLIPTIVYGVIVVLLNLFKIITGPYPFLYFYELKWYQTTLCLLGIFLGSIIISLMFYKIRNKKFKPNSEMENYQKVNNIS